MRRTSLAPLRFLSRIPTPSSAFVEFNGKLARAARVFPVAGIFIGLLPAPSSSW